MKLIFTRSKGWLAVLAVLTSFGLTSGPARAANALEIEMEELAIQIQQTLKKRDATSVAVGGFVARSHLESNASKAIQKMLSEQLVAKGVEINPRASHEIQGNYQNIDDQKSGAVGVMVAARLVDGGGRTVVEFSPRGIFGDETVASLLGITIDFPKTDRPDERGRAVRKQIENPDVHLDLEKVRIKASPDSPYAIEIHIKRGSDYSAQPAAKAGGRAFVPISADEVFAVLLVNDSEHEAAVSLSLDGLSMFAFSENNYSFIFVPKKSAVRIDGWHLSNAKSAEFKVREIPQGKNEAIKLKERSDLGVITAVFSAAWEKKEDQPRDEALMPRSATFVDKGDVIGRNFKEVKRFVGRVRSTISVRYQK